MIFFPWHFLTVCIAHSGGMQELEKARAELNDLRKQQNESAAKTQAERDAFRQVDTCRHWNANKEFRRYSDYWLCSCTSRSDHFPYQEKLMKEKKSLREQLEKMQDQMQRMVAQRQGFWERRC